MKGIELSDTLDLCVSGGHLTIGDTTEQNVQLIVITEKGEWKERPTLGVGPRRFVHSGNTEAMLREVRVQLASDGISGSASIEDGQLKIDLK